MGYVPERFWEERYSQFDLSRSGHRDLPEPYNRWLYRRKRAVLRRELARAGFDARGKRIVELGIGTGAYMGMWQALQVRSVTGLDISRAASAFAQAKYPQLKVLCRDVTEPGLAADVGTDADLVAALDVLYHVVDDSSLTELLRNVRAVLRPGGMLAFHDQFLHRPTEDHGYIRWRSLDDWHGALATAGFSVVSRTPIFFSMLQANDCATRSAAARLDSIWATIHPWIWRLPRVAGAALYAIDTLLGATRGEGPSMELLLAQRES